MAFDPADYGANLVMLADIEPARRLDTLSWTQAAAPNTTCWYVAHPEGEPSKVEADGVAMSAFRLLAECQAAELSYFYDSANTRLYVHITGGGEPASATPYLVTYHWRRCGTDVDSYDGHQYMPLLPSDSIPRIGAKAGRFHEGGTSFSFGSIKILNGDGRFDTLFNTYIWEAKRVIVRIGEKGKGDANYQTVFYGWTGNITWDDDMVEIATEDLRGLVL
jgi:hypothetical protein